MGSGGSEWKELIPFIEVSLIFFDIYVFYRIFSREVVRVDFDKPIKILSR